MVPSSGSILAPCMGLSVGTCPSVCAGGQRNMLLCLSPITKVVWLLSWLPYEVQLYMYNCVENYVVDLMCFDLMKHKNETWTRKIKWLEFGINKMQWSLLVFWWSLQIRVYLLLTIMVWYKIPETFVLLDFKIHQKRLIQYFEEYLEEMILRLVKKVLITFLSSCH